MAMSSGSSFVLSSLLTVILFSGMQIYRQWLQSTQMLTIFGGYLASMLFIFVLTAFANLETALFGKGFQTKFFPEVIFSLGIAMLAAGMVHRVCTTTCLIFSIVALYYINRISQQTYTMPVASQPVPVKRRK